MDSVESSLGNKLISYTLVLLSFGMVTFGQPAWLPWLGPLSSLCGFALFWKGMLAFRQKSSRFWLSTLWFTAVNLVQLSWLTADEYQGLYIWGIWAFLAAGCGAQFGLLSLFIRPGMKWTFLQILAVPAFWTFMEWLRLFFSAGFTWNPVGLAITGYVTPSQMITLAGIYGLSFWVMLVNVLVLLLLVRPKRVRGVTLAASAALFPYFFGLAHLFIHHQLRADFHEPPINVVLVQTGLTPKNKIDLIVGEEPVHPLVQWERIVSMVSKHGHHPIDLIILPEGAVPFSAAQLIYDLDSVKLLLKGIWGDKAPAPHSFGKEVETEYWGTLMAVSNSYFCSALAGRFNAHIIVGLDESDELSGQSYNSALHFRPGEIKTESYSKRILLPIAESIPFTWIEPIAKRYGIESSFTPGSGPRLFAGPIPLGITICYEETFPNLSRESRTLGAELLVNITADGWFPNSRLPNQHFSHGRLRALENGIPLVRSSHTGVTAAVDSLGYTLARLGDEAGNPETLSDALYVEVPRYHYRTLYSQVGDGLIVGLSLLFLAFLQAGTLFPPPK